MKLGGSLRPCGGADGRVDRVATATIRARAKRGLGERGQLVTAGKGPTWKAATSAQLTHRAPPDGATPVLFRSPVGEMGRGHPEGPGCSAGLIISVPAAGSSGPRGWVWTL